MKSVSTHASAQALVQALTQTLLALVVVNAAGCSPFNFDRDPPVTRGAIFGQAVRDDADANVAAYAQINMMGTGLVRQAASDGQFALTDLGAGTYILRFNDDVDGDGQPDRSRLLAVSMAIADKPETLGFSSGKELVSTSLGQVIIEGTGAVAGEISVVDPDTGDIVSPKDANLGARALLFRSIATESLGDAELQLGADAETHVDAQGQYRFNQALSGDFNLVVTLHELNGASRGKTVFVSEPQKLVLEEGSTVTAESIVGAVVVDDLEQQSRALEVVVAPPLAERGTPYAIFVPPGRTISTCQQVVPQVTQFTYERIVVATVADISRLNDAPQGVWDIRFCGEATFIDPATGTVEDEPTVAGATLFSIVIAPAADGVSTVLVGPVVLQRELDACLRRVCPDGGLDCDNADRELIRDCDGDGKRGIALFDASDALIVSTWNACASQCGAVVGLDAAEGTCDFDNKVFDCDDDGDLQSDASEPAACYGPGLGDDRDGDGLCTGDDAFPTCAANNADDCAAGTVDVAPVVPPEFGGGGEDVADGGFGERDGGGTSDVDSGTDGGVVPSFGCSADGECGNGFHCEGESPDAVPEVRGFCVADAIDTQFAENGVAPLGVAAVDVEFFPVGANQIAGTNEAHIFLTRAFDDGVAAQGDVFYSVMLPDGTLGLETPIFEAAIDVAFVPETVSVGEGFIDFAGSGFNLQDVYPPLFSAHFCRATVTGDVVSGDAAFGLVGGCTNDFDVAILSNVENSAFSKIVALPNGDSWALGQADSISPPESALLLQRYTAIPNLGSNTGPGRLSRFSTYIAPATLDTIDEVVGGILHLNDFITVLLVVRTTDNAITRSRTLFRTFNTTGDEVLDETGDVIFPGLVAGEETVVGAIVPRGGGAGDVTLVGTIESGPDENREARLFVMDASVAGGTFLVNVSSARTDVNSIAALKKVNAASIVPEGMLIVGAVAEDDDNDPNTDPVPQTALWRFDYLAAPGEATVSRSVLKEESFYFVGRQSQAHSLLKVDSDTFVLGQSRSNNLEVGLEGLFEGWVSKLVAPVATDPGP